MIEGTNKILMGKGEKINKKKCYDLTENVFAKNSRFSSEINPAPLINTRYYLQPMEKET